MIFYRPTFQYLKLVPIILISLHIRNTDRIHDLVTKEQNIYPPQYYNWKYVSIGSGKGFLLRCTLTNIVYNNPPHHSAQFTILTLSLYVTPTS